MKCFNCEREVYGPLYHIDICHECTDNKLYNAIKAMRQENEITNLMAEIKKMREETIQPTPKKTFDEGSILSEIFSSYEEAIVYVINNETFIEEELCGYWNIRHDYKSFVRIIAWQMALKERTPWETISKVWRIAITKQYKLFSDLFKDWKEIASYLMDNEPDNIEIRCDDGEWRYYPWRACFDIIADDAWDFDRFAGEWRISES